MGLQEIFQSLRERVQSTASVQTIYGEPIQTQHLTVIPIARVTYGFGGGFGSGRGTSGDTPREGEGGGGGGGGTAEPMGFLEISGTETRFIPVTENRKWLGALIAGMALGLWLGRRIRR